VETKKAHFEPERFEDRYEEALKDLLKKKQSGQKIEAPKEREPSKVVNLMDALRRSVETERAGGERRKPAPRAGHHRAPKKAGRSSARERPGRQKKSPAEAGLRCPMKVGLPTPMRTPERHSASRFINDERRG
jgi:hypothetical protein